MLNGVYVVGRASAHCFLRSHDETELSTNSQIALPAPQTQSVFARAWFFRADSAMLTLLRGDPLCAERQSSIGVDQR